MKYFGLWFLLVTNCLWAAKPGDILKAYADEVRPTQKVVGMLEVAIKVEEILALNKKQRKKYLMKRLVPAVIGPGKEIYIIDRHHMTRGLLEAGYRKMFLQIREDWSDLSPDEFWRKMKDNGYVYLFDENGREITPAEIPKKVMDLKDDPYRSLAYFTREAGAFNKMNIPFVEFTWANFYKHFISKEQIAKNLPMAIRYAIKLSQEPMAAGLPGYKGKAVSCKAVSQ